MSGAPIVLAAGGTGGHVFPAQALAAELQRRGRAVMLVTDRRGSGYEQRFPGVEIVRLPAGTPAGRGPVGRVLAIGEIAAGVVAAFRLLRRVRPAVVVGFGGYPSLPAMVAATRLGLPTLLHEQNAVLGRVNRLLAPRVGRIAASFPETVGLGPAEQERTTLTGNPVREAIAAVRELPYLPPQPGGPLRLLVLGGSQGARVLSEVVPEAVVALPEGLRSRLRITQQCRPEDLDPVRQTYLRHGVSADLAPFLEDVPALLAGAHLCITRAGASTVAELTCAGRPALLVPYPHATDDHQTANAKALAAAGGAWLMPQGKFKVEPLRQSLEALLQDPLSLADAAAAAAAVGRPRAARDLADLVGLLAPANGTSLPHEPGRAAA